MSFAGAGLRHIHFAPGVLGTPSDFTLDSQIDYVIGELSLTGGVADEVRTSLESVALESVSLDNSVEQTKHLVANAIQNVLAETSIVSNMRFDLLEGILGLASVEMSCLDNTFYGNNRAEVSSSFDYATTECSVFPSKNLGSVSQNLGEISSEVSYVDDTTLPVVSQNCIEFVNAESSVEGSFSPDYTGVSFVP